MLPRLPSVTSIGTRSTLEASCVRGLCTCLVNRWVRSVTISGMWIASSYALPILPDSKPCAPAYSPWSEANTITVLASTDLGIAAITSPIA